MERIFNPRQFGALGDGITLDTKAIQAAIDEAGIAAERGAKTIVVLSKGIYLTSSLFLKSHMEFRMEEGAILLGTTDESQYPIMHTRVAGVEFYLLAFYCSNHNTLFKIFLNKRIYT